MVILDHGFKGGIMRQFRGYVKHALRETAGIIPPAPVVLDKKCSAESSLAPANLALHGALDVVVALRKKQSEATGQAIGEIAEGVKDNHGEPQE
jgi:hypothetical protein